MNRTPRLKVYGHVYPVSEEFFAALAVSCAGALPDTPDIPVLNRDGDMAVISCEGAHFPVDETLEALAQHISREHKGKLDVIDMENWRLTRHVIEQGKIRSNAVPLNHVLDFAESSG